MMAVVMAAKRTSLIVSLSGRNPDGNNGTDLAGDPFGDA